MDCRVSIKATLKTFFDVDNADLINALVSVETGEKTVQEAARVFSVPVSKIETLLMRYKKVMHHFPQIIMALKPAVDSKILEAIRERFVEGYTYDQLVERHGGIRNNYARVATKLGKKHKEAMEVYQLYNDVFM